MTLNLDNFESAGLAWETPFVLTSPTSLQACAALDIQPKDLLYRSIEQFEEIFSDLSLAQVYKLYEDSETLRQERLLKCRAMRHKLKSSSAAVGNNGKRSRNRRAVTSFGVTFKDEKEEENKGQNDHNIHYSSDTESNDGLGGISGGSGPASGTVNVNRNRKQANVYSTRSVPDLRSNLDFQKPTWSPREYCPCQFQLEDEVIYNDYLKRYGNIFSGELSSEDRKILECLVLKKGRALEWDKKSQELRKNFESERLRRFREEQTWTQKWHDRLSEKRRLENEENARRYLEIQGKWKESRDNLQKQLEDRDERVHKYLEELKHQKRMHLVEKQKAEALRQLEIGKSIERMMEEDRKQRQKMRERLQKRMKEAEMRKRRREYDYWRHVQEMNRLEEAKRCMKLEQVQQTARLGLEELRTQIEEKEHRAQMNYLALQRRLRAKDKEAGQSLSGRTEKVQMMHAQLVKGLQDWHKKVLELHMAAQGRAEMKYVQEMNRRRARVMSERVLREERALEIMRKVRETEDKRRELTMMVIDSKESKAALHKAERERKQQISRLRAAHAAELRQQLRDKLDPETFDRKASRVEFELRVMKKSPAILFTPYKVAPRCFTNHNNTSNNHAVNAYSIRNKCNSYNTYHHCCKCRRF